MDLTGGTTPYLAGMAGAGFVAVTTLTVWQRSRRSLRRRLAALTMRLGSDTADAEAGGTERVLARVERAAESLLISHNDAERRAARLAGALDAMPLGVILADDLGTIEYRNVLAESMAGGHGDVLVEQALEALLERARRSDEAVEDEVDLFGPPRRHYVLRGRPVDDGHRAVGVMATVEDETERRRMDEVRRDFIANVGQELRSPVGALAVLAEMLAEETAPTVMKRLAARLGAEASRVVRVLEDVIELSRLEAEANPVRQAVSITSVVSEAVSRATPMADTRGVTVVAPARRRRLSVLGDRRQLVAALFNLVENAVKYSERGGSVEIGIDAVEDRVQLSVTDHGIGIPARDLDRIFERFYRVERDADPAGSGLGLSIVRHVASAHAGSVAVTSQEGAGSRFVLDLPLALDQPRAVDATGSIPIIPGATAGLDPDGLRSAG
ncbi:MAG: sensor histidine kinase [Acidimicrobiales bacterium]